MRESPNTARVSAYRKSKSTISTTRGFGLKLGCPLRDRWVAADAQYVSLELEGVQGVLEVKLLKGFWKECAEFMHDAIHGWIVSQGLAIPWPTGKPHHFEMERLSESHFRVRRAASR
jgi:hypothetical protein